LKINRYIFIFFSCLWFLQIPSIAQVPDYKVKAVMIDHFTKFIQWPNEEEPGNFVICVVGKNIFGSYLEEMYKDRKIKNKKVQIIYAESISQLKDCNILFIADNKADELDKILDFASDKPILTVSDTEGFARQGVIINFYIETEKVKFEVNLSSAQKTMLEISFRLLNSARIIKNKGK
jgi:hypothetical protein